MKIVSPAQSRAARGLLNWTQPNLSERCGVSANTISAFEAGRGAAQKTIKKIFTVLDNAGIEFLEGDGVKRRTSTVFILEGDDANLRLIDDVYHTLKQAGGEVLIAGIKEAGSDNPKLRDHLLKHIDRLKAANITERILVEEGDTDFIAPPHWYRWLPKGYFTDQPFQLYGTKLALITWGPPQNIIVIDHDKIAASFRNLFNFAWDRAQLVDHGDGP